MFPPSGFRTYIFFFLFPPHRDADVSCVLWMLEAFVHLNNLSEPLPMRCLRVWAKWRHVTLQKYWLAIVALEDEAAMTLEPTAESVNHWWDTGRKKMKTKDEEAENGWHARHILNEDRALAKIIFWKACLPVNATVRISRLTSSVQI